MPTIARVRPDARKRRAFAVVAAACIFAVVPASPAGAEPLQPRQIGAGAQRPQPTAAVLRVGNAKPKPVMNPATLPQDEATGLKAAIRWLTREFMSRVRGPDRTSNKNA